MLLAASTVVRSDVGSHVELFKVTLQFPGTMRYVSRCAIFSLSFAYRDKTLR